MGEIRKTYDIEFKRKAVAMFLEEGLGYRLVAKTLSFFGHLKSECFRLDTFSTEEELIMAIEQYIHFYNHERFQQKLNNLSPIEYRTNVA